MRWIRRQRDENTAIYRIALDDRVYVAVGLAWLLTAIGTGWYF